MMLALAISRFVTVKDVGQAVKYQNG